MIVEKPFGRDLASARALNATLHEVFPERSVFRIDHYLGKEAVENLLFLLFVREDAVEAAWAVVDPILGDVTPVHLYEPATWGPAEAERLVPDGEVWSDPAGTLTKS